MMKFDVVVPEGYGETDQRYPVLYEGLVTGVVGAGAVALWFFLIDVTSDTAQGGKSEFGGVSGIVRWIGNHVTLDTVVSDPTTPSVVADLNVNVAAGEAIVDGQLFVYGASIDEPGDAEIDKTGADVSGVSVTVGTELYGHWCFVNNAGTRETVLVRGDEVAGVGTAIPLTEDEIATALGVYLPTTGPYYGFVRIADSVFTESTGMTEVTTSLRPVLPYN